MWHPDAHPPAGTLMQWWLNAATILGWLLSASSSCHSPTWPGPWKKRLAFAGFLAGYSGLTRQAYERDLRQFAAGASSTSGRLTSFSPAACQHFDA